MNIAILMGRLTATPELKHTTSGISVTSFNLAIDRRFKTGDEKQTDFINCMAWRQTAEFITKYFQKGSMIAVEGTIQTRKYTDKNGNNRVATDVVVNQVHFTGEKQGTQTSNQPDIEQDGYTECIDDDLPF